MIEFNDLLRNFVQMKLSKRRWPCLVIGKLATSSFYRIHVIFNYTKTLSTLSLLVRIAYLLSPNSQPYTLVTVLLFQNRRRFLMCATVLWILIGTCTRNFALDYMDIVFGQLTQHKSANSSYLTLFDVCFKIIFNCLIRELLAMTEMLVKRYLILISCHL